MAPQALGTNPASRAMGEILCQDHMLLYLHNGRGIRCLGEVYDAKTACDQAGPIFVASAALAGILWAFPFIDVIKNDQCIDPLFWALRC